MARTKKKYRVARLSKDTTVRVDQETVKFLSKIGEFPIDTIYLYDLSFSISEINYIQMVYKHFLLRYYDQYVNGDMPPLPLGTKMELYLLLTLSKQIEHHSEKIRLLNDTIGSQDLLENSNETRSYIIEQLVKVIQETVEESDEILEKQRIIQHEISDRLHFPFQENPHFNFKSLEILKPLQKGIDAAYKYLVFDKVLRKNTVIPKPIGTPFEIYLILSVVDLRNYFKPLEVPEDDENDEMRIFNIIQTALPNLTKIIDSIYTQCRNTTSHRHTNHQLQSASIENKIQHFKQCAIESISMKIQDEYWASGTFDEDIVTLKTAIIKSDVQNINRILHSHPHIFQPGRKNEALALAVLCTRGTDICDILIHAGADVNYPENSPPLYQALIKSDIEKCVFLTFVGASLHNGANYICECAGMRPLNLPAVEFLLSCRISPSSVSSSIHFDTPVISAIKIHNSLEMCRLLILHSANLNCTSRLGETPLTLAMSIDNHHVSYLMCKMLLENGASPTTISTVIRDHGHISTTPIHLARELNRIDLVHLLLQYIN